MVLSAQDKAIMAALFWQGWTIRGRSATWDDMTLEEQMKSEMEWARTHRKDGAAHDVSDEPRDDHGRWTTGGGGSDTATTSKPSTGRVSVGKLSVGSVSNKWSALSPSVFNIPGKFDGKLVNADQLSKEQRRKLDDELHKLNDRLLKQYTSEENPDRMNSIDQAMSAVSYSSAALHQPTDAPASEGKGIVALSKNGQFRGGAAFHEKPNGDIELDYLGSFQRGAGSKLLAAVEDYARAHNNAGVVLFAVRFARSFYESQGYKQVNHDGDYYKPLQDYARSAKLTADESDPIGVLALNDAVISKHPVPKRAQKFVKSAVYLTKYNEDEPRDDHGRWTTGGSSGSSEAKPEKKPAGEEMVSPQTREGLSLDEAIHELGSARQHEVMQIAAQADHIAHLDTSQAPTIGAWKDGAENSILVTVNAPATWKQIEASAAMKGMLADQKAVIPFRVQSGGKDTMYHFDVHGSNLHEIHNNLDKSGLEYHTLEPHAGGTRVWIFDQGSQLRDFVLKASGIYGSQVTAWKGKGSFLGGDTRAEGRQAYAAAIEHDLGPDARRQWQGLYDRWRETHPPVKSFPVRKNSGASRSNVVRLKDAAGHDVSDEPRDDHGRWTTGGGGGSDSTSKPSVPASLAGTIVAEGLQPAQYHEHAVEIMSALDKAHADDKTWNDNVAAVKQAMSDYPMIHAAQLGNVPEIEKSGLVPAHDTPGGAHYEFDKISGLDRTVFMRMGQAGGGGMGAVGAMIDPTKLDESKFLITRLGAMTMKQDEDAFLKTPGDHSALVREQLAKYRDLTIPYRDLADVQSRLLVNGYTTDHPGTAGTHIPVENIVQNDHGEMEVKYADRVPSKAIVAYFAGDQPLPQFGNKSAYDWLKGKVPDSKLVKYEGEGLHDLSRAYRRYYAYKPRGKGAAYLTKYNEDEPRDDHGRWTTGGDSGTHDQVSGGHAKPSGGAAKPSEGVSKETILAKQDKLQKEYGINVENAFHTDPAFNPPRDALPLDQWNHILDAAQTELDRYKAAGMDLGAHAQDITIHATPIKDFEALLANADAMTSGDAHHIDVQFSPSVAGDAMLKKIAAYERDKGTPNTITHHEELLHPHDPNAYQQATFRHEWGHVLTYTNPSLMRWVQRNKSALGFSPKNVSKYVSSYGSSSPHEGIAEIFNKYFSPDYKQGSMPAGFERIARAVLHNPADGPPHPIVDPVLGPLKGAQLDVIGFEVSSAWDAHDWSVIPAKEDVDLYGKAKSGAVLLTKYNEDEPRDDHGRWTTGGGGSDAGSNNPSASNAKPSGSASNAHDGHDAAHAIETSSVDEAAKALAEGKYVNLTQETSPSTLLDKFAQLGRDAQAKGEKAPAIDLAHVTIRGTNLFMNGNLGIPRVDMPQLAAPAAKLEPGSPAAKLVADGKLPLNSVGWVDLTPNFVQHMKDIGISSDETTRPADYLRATQREIDGVKVGSLMDAMAERKVDLPKMSRVITSKDDYVLDGHHRWAAEVGLEYKQGQKLNIDVLRFNAPITTVLREAKDWTKQMGVPTAGFGKRLRELLEKAGAVFVEEQRVLHQAGRQGKQRWK